MPWSTPKHSNQGLYRQQATPKSLTRAIINCNFTRPANKAKAVFFFVHLDCSRSRLHTSHIGLTCCIVPHTAIHIHTHTGTQQKHRDPHTHTPSHSSMTTTSAWGSPFVCLCTKGVIARCGGEEVGDIFPEVEGIRLVCPPLPNHILN